MIRSFLAFGALSAIALTGETASAQYVYVAPPPVYVRPAPVYVAPPVYQSPGISAAVQLGGLSLGYSSGYGYGSPYYGRPYFPAPYYSGYRYGGYGHYHHGYHR